MICVGVAQDYGTGMMSGKKWDTIFQMYLWHCLKPFSYLVLLVSWMKLLDSGRPLHVSGITTNAATLF